MAAIQRQRPHDREAWALAHHHFGCARETAASLQADAQVAPMPGSSPCLVRQRCRCSTPATHQIKALKLGREGVYMVCNPALS